MNNYDKLSPEQKIIADKWGKEVERRRTIIKQLKDKLITEDESFDLLEKTVPDYCEHGTSTLKHCEDCEEIEVILNADTDLSQES